MARVKVRTKLIRGIPVNGSVLVDQKYNITYYIKTSWKRSKIKSEIMNQYKLLHFIKMELLKLLSSAKLILSIPLFLLPRTTLPQFL